MNKKKMNGKSTGIEKSTFQRVILVLSSNLPAPRNNAVRLA